MKIFYNGQLLLIKFFETKNNEVFPFKCCVLSYILYTTKNLTSIISNIYQKPSFCM